MPRGLLIGCALVLWPMTIAGSAFVMAWLREAVRQRRVRLMLGVAGLFDVLLPATLLGPALAGLVYAVVMIHTEHGNSVLGPLFSGAMLSVFFFWPLYVAAFLIGVVHRFYWSQNVLGEDAAASPGEVRSAGRQPPAARKQGLLFREKEAKSFCPGCRGPSHRRVPKRQKFFGSFFQKELLPSLCTCHCPELWPAWLHSASCRSLVSCSG